jgi:hypothetical protein
MTDPGQPTFVKSQGTIGHLILSNISDWKSVCGKGKRTLPEYRTGERCVSFRVDSPFPVPLEMWVSVEPSFPLQMCSNFRLIAVVSRVVLAHIVSYWRVMACGILYQMKLLEGWPVELSWTGHERGLPSKPGVS